MAENPNTNKNMDSDVLIDGIAEKLESVTRLNPEPLSFSDLPNEILGEIVENLDLVSRLKTRKVSRRLRSVVDNQKAYYDIICICTEKNQIHILFDEVMVHYGKSGCLIHDEDDDEIVHKFIEDDNFLEIALNDLAIALKKPKFWLLCLGLTFDCDAEAENAKVLNFLESLKSPIHAKSILTENYGNHDVLPILSLLDPGTLEIIDLNRMNEGINADELVKMDQWKQARIVSLGEIPLRFEDFLHFDEFNLHVDSISTQDVLRLRDVLSKSENFRKCRLDILHGFMNIDEIGRALQATVVPSLNGPILKNFYQISGSNKFLYFEIHSLGLFIEKTP